jgi:hypothetical protein
VDVEGLGPALGVERFVEHFFDVGRSNVRGRRDTLGWAAGSGPPGDHYVGWFPDALVPIALATSWAPWPMAVPAGQNGVVWVDLTVPPDLGPRRIEGRVIVRADGRTLATIPLSLEVLDATLPARPVRTWLFYERGALRKRMGAAEAAEPQLLQLFHRHRVTGFNGVGSVDGVRAALPALDGTLYQPAAGYRGPAQGVGDDLVVLGTYATFGDATPAHLREVEAIADELAAHAVFDRADVFLYAEDEDCASPRGAAWRALLASSPNANARRVRVGWTCSTAPAEQPVDLPIVFSSEYDPKLTAAARSAGKEVWIYSGYRPATGALLTDTEPVGTRTFGWIAAMAGISRWFIWDSCNWADGNPGGHGAFDPFVTAATGHDDRDGSTLMGDGLLVYPGRQLEPHAAHSLGFDGVIPSIRLKNLRRGIEDAGYYLLARGAARDEADAIARRLLPRILAEARFEDPPSWDERGAPFFEARRALARLIGPGTKPGPPGQMGAGPRPAYFHLRKRHIAVGVLAAGLAAAVTLHRKRRRTDAQTATVVRP